MLVRPSSTQPGVRASQLSNSSSAVPLYRPGSSKLSRPSSAIYRPGSSKLSRPSSATSLSTSAGRSKASLFSPALQEPLGTSGTRVMKDWQLASDPAQRGKRADDLYLRRQAASTGQLPGIQAGDDASACPLARGPRGEQLRKEVRPSSASWHKRQVRQIYKTLDPKLNGVVRLEQLRQSFEDLSVPIDDETFERYAQDLLPSSAGNPDAAVLAPQFASFHQEVWANQPGFVRWQAGDPSEGDDSTVIPDPPDVSGMSVADAVMQYSSLAPPAVTTSDMRNNELHLRKAFQRHADNRSALLSFDKIPTILQDLGLPANLPDVVREAEARSTETSMENLLVDEVSFHQTVAIVNKCIATHEASRASTPANSGSKMNKRLEAALRFSTEAVEDDATEEALFGDPMAKARLALESALSEDDTPRTIARHALEQALLGDDTPRSRARHALEASLLGGGDVDADTPRARAVRALEVAFFGDPAEGETRRRMSAMHALEAALLGELDEDTPRAKAKKAVELALLGHSEDDPFGDESPRARAQHAIETALLGLSDGDLAAQDQIAPEAAPDADEDLKAEARSALEACLDAEDEALKEEARSALEAGLDADDAALASQAQDALETAPDT